MNNLKEAIKKAGLSVGKKADFMLGRGAKRIQNGEQIIWGNLFNGTGF